jgi:hypothetical protein
VAAVCMSLGADALGFWRDAWRRYPKLMGRALSRAQAERRLLV